MGDAIAATRLPMAMAAAMEARDQPNSASSCGAKTPRIGLKKTTAVKFVRQTVPTTVQP
jgi:hypothetical protein